MQRQDTIHGGDGRVLPHRRPHQIPLLIVLDFLEINLQEANNVDGPVEGHLLLGRRRGRHVLHIQGPFYKARLASSVLANNGDSHFREISLGGFLQVSTVVSNQTVLVGNASSLLSLCT